jgi:hypothetical protein
MDLEGERKGRGRGEKGEGKGRERGEVGRDQAS